MNKPHVKKIRSAAIHIVFTSNNFKQSAIDGWFPESIFTRSHDWETCPIDGCMNCVYKTNPGVDPDAILYNLIDFVNGCLNSDKNSDDERVRVTRKLLSHTRLIPFELNNCCRILFKIHWFDVATDKSDD